MNWDWDKLSEQRQRKIGGPKPPNVDDINSTIRKFRGTGLPGGKFIILGIIVLWFLSGVYIVEPDEVGVVTRFGKYVSTTGPGPHYHLPVPIESVMRPKVTQIRRVEVGFRSYGSSRSFTQGQSRNLRGNHGTCLKNPLCLPVTRTSLMFSLLFNTRSKIRLNICLR
ncbi:protein of unknown function [Maridesulfovibrio hydrothermalis AM13 = DSM 14728]|uniref:Band 7 domain-containing protein n=1 Tax=Maridesulfovibrio hydrothermalis AM13 = DSM 14728 TaxID=1121451 RepID=L0R9F5_9BACT|nr:SPFH domain-containing protein [Maridesulfovibrio hydrothermalis]CCO22847.1 protein of unknown function [Maridesulfovibrio hydrothermalis AM13 = DSM 14728]